MSAPVYGGGSRYESPDLLRWLDSYEGVPEVADPGEAVREAEARSGWRARGHELFEMLGALLPGVVLAGALALAGQGLSGWLGESVMGLSRSPVSPILLAIALGLLLRNTLGLPLVYDSGLRLCVKRVLRVGVALLGLRLSLAAAGWIGVVALPLVVGCIGVALVAVSQVNRILGLPRRLGTLIAVGTSICGNTAIVATGPAIQAEDDEVSYAVACVTLFGLLGLLTYPYLSHWLFAGDANQAGLFLGTAIHDTSQVAGAGLVFAQQYGDAAALETATVTKLVRNLFMIAVIPLMAVFYRRGEAGAAGASGARWSELVPFFVLAFVAMTALRSVGDLGERPFGVLDPADWERLLELASTAANTCLAVAMAAVGLGTSFAKLRILGLRPLAVGMAAAFLVGAVSFGLIRLFDALGFGVAVGSS